MLLSLGLADDAPPALFHAVIAGVQILITVAYVAAAVPEGDLRFFYALATPYAVFFFRPRHAVLHAAWVGVQLAGALGLLGVPAGAAVGLWLMTMGTIAAVGSLVGWAVAGLRYSATHDPKAAGPGSVVVYDDAMRSGTARRLALEGALRKAIARDELALAYQPVIDVASGRIRSVEALLRWNSAQFGAVSPAEFIPLAEETGLIVPIGEWVLRQALGQLAVWRRDGDCDPDLTMAVNVSVKQLRSSFPDTVTALLEANDLPSAALVLEITESVFVDATAGTTDVLRWLRDAGIALALDDFGTGYSSLSYLQTPLFAVVKGRPLLPGELAQHAGVGRRRLPRRRVPTRRDGGGGRDGRAGRPRPRSRLPVRPGLSVQPPETRRRTTHAASRQAVDCRRGERPFQRHERRTTRHHSPRKPGGNDDRSDIRSAPRARNCHERPRGRQPRRADHRPDPARRGTHGRAGNEARPGCGAEVVRLGVRIVLARLPRRQRTALRRRIRRRRTRIPRSHPRRLLQRSVGLSGRAWKTRDLYFVPDLGDVTDCVRAPAAQRVGVESGVCFPLIVDGTVVGTMDFFATEHLTLTGSRLQTLRQVGRLVSGAMERFSDVERSSAAAALIASIEEINNSVHLAGQAASEAVGHSSSTQDAVAALGTASTEIGKVVKTISGIAAQTDLIALNATIEAARAGEAGRGFAVVAGEVKELARETNTATDDVGHRIAAIQSGTNGAIEAIGAIVSAVENVNRIHGVIGDFIERQAAVRAEFLARSAGQ